MPGPYNPPQPRRTQVVPTRRGASTPRWRLWWLVPMLGLVPVLAAVLATQGAFNAPPAARQPAQPVAGAATTVSVAGVTAVPTVATTAVAPTVATSQPSAATTTTAGSGTGASTTSPTVGTTGSSGGAGSQPRASATPTTPGTSAAFVAYRVQPGDTVRFVAQAYGVSPASIIQASGLSNPDLLRIGQVLTVPSQPGWLYRVQPGETLDQIAARTGVAGDRIASASGLSIASVGPGDVLLIPDQSAAAQGK